MQCKSSEDIDTADARTKRRASAGQTNKLLEEILILVDHSGVASIIESIH
jgi:hypothetical protein